MPCINRSRICTGSRRVVPVPGLSSMRTPISVGPAADIVAIAVASGLTQSSWAADEDDFERLIEASMSASGPTLIGVRIDDKPGTGTTRRDPVQIRERFMHGMGVREPL